MSRIEVTAILKSCLEGGVNRDDWSVILTQADLLLEEYGGGLNSGGGQTQGGKSSPPPAPASIPPTGENTLTCKQVYDNGKYVKVIFTDAQGGEHTAGAWDADAQTARRLVPGQTFSAVLKQSGKYLNLKSVKAEIQDIPF